MQRELGARKLLIGCLAAGARGVLVIVAGECGNRVPGLRVGDEHKAPERHARREIAAGIRFGSNQLLQTQQGPAPADPVLILRRRFSGGLPNVIEPIDVSYGLGEIIPLMPAEATPRFQMLPIGGVKSQHFPNRRLRGQPLARGQNVCARPLLSTSRCS